MGAFYDNYMLITTNMIFVNKQRMEAVGFIIITHYVLKTMLSPLCVSSHLILSTAIWYIDTHITPFHRGENRGSWKDKE